MLLCISPVFLSNLLFLAFVGEMLRAILGATMRDRYFVLAVVCDDQRAGYPALAPLGHAR